MSYFKRVLLLFSIGASLLAGLMFTTHTTVSSTAHANGCDTVAQGWNSNLGRIDAHWDNTCTVSDTENSHSNAVYGIQLVIKYSGFKDPQTGQPCTVGNVDGFFGQNTHDGVVCFQKAWNAGGANHIDVDGIVGQQTWGALSIEVEAFSVTVGANVWNYFNEGNPNNDDFRMWGQLPYKWYVDAGGCWRQMAVNSTACA